ELERLDVEEVRGEAHRSLEERIAARTRELEASEQKFATAFRCSPDAMVITCLKTGHVLEINESFISMTGYQREDVIGRTALEIGFWVYPAQREALHRALDAGEAVRNLEFAFRRYDGDQRVGLLSAESIALGHDPCTIAVI